MASSSGTDKGMGVVRAGTALGNANMKTQANQAAYLAVLIGGVAAILSGIAAVMAWMPSSTDGAGVVLALDQPRAPPAVPIGAQAPISSARADGEARVRVKCPECGVVESTREIEQRSERLAEGIDPVAAGGMTRVGRNEIPGKSTHMYEVTVRMMDGSRRVFTDANLVNWRAGERVILIGGASRSND
jgi:hypothetical protein